VRPSLDWALSRLGGVRTYAGYYTAHCPAHNDRNASLSVRESEAGKLLFKCFAGCDYRSIIDALGGELWPGALRLPAKPAKPALKDGKLTEIARRIWRESRPAADTLVQAYLRSRGITILPPASLRFHPTLKHPSGVYAPAVVAAVQTDNQINAVHRTWLKADGTGKADMDPPKAALGPIRGHAVRLAQAREVLALAEGRETALSVQQATGIATWATLGTANLPRVKLPDCVREVIICADNDVSGAGETAALAAAAKFTREGRRVRIARPPSAGMDFNDLLRT